MYIERLIYPSDNAILIQFVNLHQMILDIFNQQTSLFYYSWQITIDSNEVEVLDETYDGEYYTLYLNSNYDISEIHNIVLMLNLTFKQKRMGDYAVNMKANEIIQLQTAWHRISSPDDKYYEMMPIGCVEATPGEAGRIIHDILMPKWVSTKHTPLLETSKHIHHISEEDIVDVEYEEVKENDNKIQIGHDDKIVDV